MVGPESFVIEIEAAKVGTLMQEFLNDTNLLAQNLKILNNRMVLLNPKFQNSGPEEEAGPERQ